MVDQLLVPLILLVLGSQGMVLLKLGALERAVSNHLKEHLED